MMKKLTFPKSFSFSIKWLGIVGIACTIILVAALIFMNKWENAKHLQTRLERLKQKEALSSLLKEKEELYVSQLDNSDSYYLFHELENFTPLSKEILSLEALTDFVKQDKILQGRLSLLTTSNRIIFQEEAVRKENSLQEVEVKQKNPIEIDERDLQELLCKIEGIDIPGIKKAPGRPQIVIKDFRLERKEHPTKDTYLMSMQIIKREKTQK